MLHIKVIRFLLNFLFILVFAIPISFSVPINITLGWTPSHKPEARHSPLESSPNSLGCILSPKRLFLVLVSERSIKSLFPDGATMPRCSRKQAVPESLRCPLSPKPYGTWSSAPSVSTWPFSQGLSAALTWFKRAERTLLSTLFRQGLALNSYHTKHTHTQLRGKQHIQIKVIAVVHNNFSQSVYYSVLNNSCGEYQFQSGLSLQKIPPFIKGCNTAK